MAEGMNAELMNTELINAEPNITSFDEFNQNIIHSHITWNNYPITVNVQVKNKQTYTLKIGDFVTWDERDDSGVIIIKFYGDKETIGPIGFTFLPWRDEPSRSNGRWATPAITLKGDPRFVICYPEGSNHFGLHLNWESLEIINELAPLSNLLYRDKLNSILNTIDS